ncbi:hypothetical protein [Haloarcula rara]|uniref:hypothetical protein n=1 Tax=Haloarcula rara TaxID=3033387 RepID=UPI0023E7A9E4|nr:hypothetical protein [Halomicroarcula sp. SHR3]
MSATTRTVDLGTEGLQAGDVIDDYLDEHLEDGTKVTVPAGEYEWRGDGLDGRYEDAALVGDGEVTFRFEGDYWNLSIFAVGGGDFTIQNVTVRGPVESEENKSRFRFDARDPDSTVRLDNFNLPDGDVGYGRAIGIYVGLDHEGTVHLTNCHVEGFPNNGLYAGPYGKSDGGGGRVLVERCLFVNNNIDGVRLGGDGDTIRDSVIVQEDVPAYVNGAKSGRGLRIRYPGDDITVENVHITCDTSKPFIVPDRAEGPSGQVSGLFIENNTESSAAVVESGTFSADNVHVTGSGDKDVTGFDSATNVFTGSEAESPATSLAELDGDDSTSGNEDGDDSTSGNEDGDDSTSGNGTEEDTEDALDQTLTVDGTSSAEKSYTFEVTGEVRAGDNINPDDTVNESSVDGTMFSSSDSYQFSGELVRFESDALDEMTVLVNGSPIDPTALGEDSSETTSRELTLTGSTREPKAYSFTVSESVTAGDNINPDDTISERSVEGVVWFSTDSYTITGELLELTVDSPDDVTVTLDGETIDPEAVGDETSTDDGTDSGDEENQLPKRLVVDGTGDPGPATYTIEVSEAMERDTELDDTEADDTVTGTGVNGTLGDDIDSYRFAGHLVSMRVTGQATVTIEEVTE